MLLRDPNWPVSLGGKSGTSGRAPFPAAAVFALAARALRNQPRGRALQNGKSARHKRFYGRDTDTERKRTNGAAVFDKSGAELHPPAGAIAPPADRQPALPLRAAICLTLAALSFYRALDHQPTEPPLFMAAGSAAQINAAGIHLVRPFWAQSVLFAQMVI